MFFCYPSDHQIPQVAKGSTAKEAYNNYKELYDEYVSLDYLVFLEVPDSTPLLKYRTELVLVGT